WWLERDKVSWATIAIYAAPVLLFLGIGVLRPLMDRSQGPDAPMLFSNVLALATGLFLFNTVVYSIPWLLHALPFFMAQVALAVQALRSSRGWYQLWAVMLVAFCLFPSDEKIAYLNERYLIYAWLFLPVGVVLSEHRQRWLAILSVGTAGLAGIGVWHGMARVDRVAQDTRVVLSHLPLESRLYPMNFDLQGPSLNVATL